MAQGEAESGLDLTISETIQSLVESYRQMTIPLERYLFLILLPASPFSLFRRSSPCCWINPLRSEHRFPCLDFW